MEILPGINSVIFVPIVISRLNKEHFKSDRVIWMFTGIAMRLIFFIRIGLLNQRRIHSLYAL